MPRLSDPQCEQFAVLVAAGVSIARAYSDAGLSGVLGGAVDAAGDRRAAERLATRPEITARVAELRDAFERGDVGGDYLAVLRARQRV